MTKPLTFSYDAKADILMVNGVRFSGNFLRAFAEEGLPLYQLFRIISREDGVVSIEILMDGWLRRIGRRLKHELCGGFIKGR